MTFVIAGAIAELAHTTLKDDFRNIDPPSSEIILVEAGDRVLSTFLPGLSAKAQKSLTRLGVRVLTGTRIAGIARDAVTIAFNNQNTMIKAGTILWCAGVKASLLGEVISRGCGLRLDKQGRVPVQPSFLFAGFSFLSSFFFAVFVGFIVHRYQEEGEEHDRG